MRLFFDMRFGVGEQLQRSDIFVVRQPNEYFSPVGATSSDDAAPGRSLDSFLVVWFYKDVGPDGPSDTGQSWRLKLEGLLQPNPS